MEGKILQKKAEASSTLFSDHNLPMQGEFPMKKEDGNEKNSLMEAVQLEIEIEKRKIREKIIASEIIQRRKELENEIRMEVMMEEKMIGMRSFYRDSSSVFDPYMLMNSSRYLGYQGGSYFHKNLLNVGGSEDEFREKLKFMSDHHPIDGVNDSLQMNPEMHKNEVFGDDGEEQNDVALGKRPFERDLGLAAAAHTAGKSMAEFGGEEVLNQAMPSSGISGMKRKAETPGSDEETATAASKNLQKKWYCSLCDVAATSAGGLNLHLHGKKHKAKEATSKSGDTASSISADSFCAENQMQTSEQLETLVQPLEQEKSQVQPMEEEKSQVQPMEEERSQVTKKWECSLCQVSATSETLLRNHLQGKKHKAKEAKLGICQGTNTKGAETTKAKDEAVNKWYCSLCQVSAASEKNLNDHLHGKKHKAKAGLLHQEADNEGSKSAEKVSEDVNMVQEKILEGKEGVNEQEPSKGQVSEQEMLSESNTGNTEGKKRESIYTELVKFWHCEMCNEGTCDEATMDHHRESSKHKDMLRRIGGGLIVVSNMPKEAVEREKVSQHATLNENESDS